MGHYEHEVAGLADLAARLNGLVGEFDGLDDRLKGFEGDVGHRDVAEALHDFADNWGDKREKLLEKLRQLAGFVQVAADTYAGIENELTEQYTLPPSPAPDPGPAPAVRSG